MTSAVADSGPLLMTGATGFVGMELLARVLEQTDRDVVALVRAADDGARRRGSTSCSRRSSRRAPPAPRARARGGGRPRVAGPRHLADAARADRGSVTAVVHCAASVSFTLPLEDARKINVEGTREIVKIATEAHERGVLERFVHVSTAYVAGDRTGLISEHDGDVGQGFRNTYERTKLEAEHLVTGSDLPAAIVRPSVIVGDSRTGWTQAFNVIYWPLQAFARGLFPRVPGDPGASLDIVPVDTVANALLELLRGPVRGGAFHVVAGADAPSNAELATMAAEAFDAEPPVFVALGEDEQAEKLAGALVPYFSVRSTFDARARASCSARRRRRWRSTSRRSCATPARRAGARPRRRAGTSACSSAPPEQL